MKRLSFPTTTTVTVPLLEQSQSNSIRYCSLRDQDHISNDHSNYLLSIEIDPCFCGGKGKKVSKVFTLLVIVIFYVAAVSRCFSPCDIP